MNHPRRCPVCDQLWGASCSELPSSDRDASRFQCEVCGTFHISGTALATTFDPANSALTEIQRAYLSHILCTSTSQGASPTIDTNWLRDVLATPSLPNPAVRATCAIRHIGDEVTRTGRPISKLDARFPATIGAPNFESAARLLEELSHRSLVRLGNSSTLHGYTFHTDVDLTLSGWEIYQEHKIGPDYHSS